MMRPLSVCLSGAAVLVMVLAFMAWDSQMIMRYIDHGTGHFVVSHRVLGWPYFETSQPTFLKPCVTGRDLIFSTEEVRGTRRSKGSGIHRRASFVISTARLAGGWPAELHREVSDFVWAETLVNGGRRLDAFDSALASDPSAEAVQRFLDRFVRPREDVRESGW